MPIWIVGHGGVLEETAVKAAFIYFVALLALRAAHRRTLSQWTAIDFSAAIAIGAVMGRTAVASGQSFAVGAVALVTLLLAHTAATFARYRPLFAKLVDHRVRVLVDHGRLRRGQLFLCGVTENDLLSELRQAGIARIEQLRYVLYETKGQLTLVRDEPEAADGAVVAIGLRDAAGFR